MPDFKEVVDQVIGKLPEDISDEVKTGIKSLAEQFDTVYDGKKKADAEAKSYRLQSTELKTQVETLSGRVKDLNVKITENSNDAELEALRMFKSNVAQKQRDTFIDWYGKRSGMAKFAKVKDRFDVPDRDADGKILWDKMEPEQIEKNVSSMEDLESLEYFSGSQSVFGAPGGNGNDGKSDLKRGTSFADHMKKGVEERQRQRL